MDETNYNIHTSKTQSRSVRGIRCSTIDTGSRDTNVNILAAINNVD